MKTPAIVWFEQVGKKDVGLVGGKGANLGEMLQARLPVPYGFIVTSSAYFEFIKENELMDDIEKILAGFDYENQKELSERAKKVRELIKKSPIPEKLIASIIDYYDNLIPKESEIRRGEQLGKIQKLKNTAFNHTLVAVRSSATAEDLPDASFAGQQETYLNISGHNHLLNTIVDCWASLFTDRAVYYRHKNGYRHDQVGLAAVVQKMVQSDRSGVAFSVDPVTNDDEKIVIEAIFGLGEYIVQGIVTPDHFEVRKSDFSIIDKQIKSQSVALMKKHQENQEISISPSLQNTQKCSDDEIIAIAQTIAAIETHYKAPQDVEWAIEDKVLYIVQSRPITTLHSNQNIKDENINIKSLLLSGDPASPGVACGKPVIISSPSENDKVKKGDILVTVATNPDFVPAMKRSAAIVTEKGGRTSHAAIVAREFGLPAVVGAEGATKKLANLYEVTVNGSSGQIFLGNQIKKSSKQETKKIKEEEYSYDAGANVKIYINCAEPELAKKYSQMPVDGIGLLRAEFILAQFGIHPGYLIDQGKEDQFVDHLAKNLETFTSSFYPRPVVYRATDFKTNEYSHLKGAQNYEPHEENPMIGYRGAGRYLVDEKVFAAEIKAINKVNQKFDNLILMLPFVRVPHELVAIKQVLKDLNYYQQGSKKLWMMVEVPATAILLESFLEIGIDGVSIGTNDLTMLTLGVDRDNEKVADLYDERNRAVLWLLEHIVTTCKKYKVKCSVCGQAPSDYPELAKKLIDWGVTSLSVNPDAVEKTREILKSTD